MSLIFNTDSASFKTLTVVNSIQATSSYANTASYVTGSIFTSTNRVLSSSYALTASYALNGGGGSSTLPGGLNTQIQYNNIGAFAGVPTLTYDGTTLRATGSFSGSFNGTSSWAQSSSQALTASYVPNYVLNSATSSFVTNSQTSSFVTNSQTSSFVTNSQTSSFVTNSQTSSFVQNNQTSSFVTNSQTSSFTQNSVTSSMLQPYVLTTSTSSFVKSVNGSFPTAGNVAVALSKTITGTSASLILSSSGAVTGSISDASVWIIANNTPDPTKNGISYIFSSGSVGQWYLIPSLDTVSGDARYLRLTPQSALAGTLDLGTNNITNVGTMFGTASWATNATNAPNYLLLSNTSSMLQPYVLSSNTSSFVQNSQTSSFVTNSQTSSFVTNSQTSSFVKNSQTSSMTVATASYVTGSIFTSANPVLSSSYARNSLSSSYSLNGGVTQIVAGTNISINNSGLGTVTVTAAGVAPGAGGSSTQIQYNNVGALAGVPTLTYSAATGLRATGSFSGSLNGTASFASKTYIKLIQDYEHNGNPSGTGNGETLSAYGYTSGTAASAFPLTAAKWGSIPTTATYDSCVWQEAMLALTFAKSGFVQSADDRRYVLNRKIYLPASSSLGSTTNPYMFGIEGRGCFIDDSRLSAEASGGLFSKVPISSASSNNVDLEYSWTIKDMNVYGTFPALSGSYGFELGATKRSLLSNLDVSRYDIGIRSSMMLNCVFDRINTIFCATAGVKFEKGWWPSASQAQTVSQVTINNSRFNTSLSSSVGLWLENCDQTEGSKLQFEGASGSYGLYYDTTPGATVIKNAYFKNLRFESETKYINALIGYKARDSFNFIAELGFHQATKPGTYLIETEAYDGTNPVVVLKYWDNNGGNTAWKINNLNQGTCFDLTSVRLPGNPATAAAILASGTSIFDGTMPSSNRLRYTPPMPT